VQQQQARHEQTVLRHELSATEQKAKAERAAHEADRKHLIAKQQQMAAQERGQAAINERLRLQNERMRAIVSQRQQSVDRQGQTIIKEPGNRTIIQVNGRAFVQHDETVNFKLYGGTPQIRRAPNGNSISTIVRPDGVRIEVEVDGFGRPIRRVRFLPDGRRFVLFENRAIAIGAGFALGAFVVALDPPHIEIPREQYIVNLDVAPEDDIYAALQAGPVEPLDRGYSLDEVLASVDLRARMRSINIDSINFEFGSADVGPDQAVMLETVAAVIRDMARDNPGEVFLIEGHTDAVGSDVDNLSLSDRRAGAVADLLAQQFGVPRENLVTQGYGKQFLLIPTDEPERRNRRVVVRRITPLLQAGDQYSSNDGGPGDPGPR
jgi:outer membrane protein OmpA-like peptidoglycan-associated protein